jgi:putative Mn2+ efflux pump MntP
MRENNMEWSILFFFNSVLLGIGLAMDAFSVSLANGLNEAGMKKSKMFCIAGVFALFQALMPMLGWICVHTVLQYFKVFENFIPWIALVLLAFIGGKMLFEGIRNDSDNEENTSVGITALLVQAIATSIDALSVGFTIAEYNAVMATVCAAIIAVVTFFICMAGLAIGKKVGTKFSNKAAILGGSILILIGLEIFITGIL